MRTLLDIRPLCLYLCICLSGLQFLSAHDTKDQAIDGAEVKAMGQGNAQAMTFGQEVNYQTYNRTMANSTGQAIGQGSSRGMHDTQPNVKNACDFQAPSNAKDQGQMGSGQAMGKSKDQTLKQSKDSQNSSHSSNDHCSGHNEGGVEVLEVTGAHSLNLILTKDITAAQSLQGGNTNQAQPLVGAPPPNNAIMPVAPPPNNAVLQGGISNGTPQQLNDGQAGDRSTNVQAANNSGARPMSASKSARFSSVASATSSTGRAGIAAAMSAPRNTGTGSAGAGACRNCRCNCPMAAFPVVQRVAMMAAMATASLSQSTLQTVTSANEAQADASTTPQQSLAAPIKSAPSPQTPPLAMATPPPGPPIAQTQANQAPKVASPQAQGVTAWGAAAALPTNLSTFTFQSAVTVSLGKR